MDPIAIVPAGRVSMVGQARRRCAASAAACSTGSVGGTILDLESCGDPGRVGSGSRGVQPSAAASLDTFERALSAVSDVPADAGQSLEAAIATPAPGRQRADRSAGARHALSRRQFERRFAERVGLSPRLFGRTSGSSVPCGIWARRWRGCRRTGGYADQAHLVREIRDSPAGRPPRSPSPTG
jgi:hypothetical protein